MFTKQITIAMALSLLIFAVASTRAEEDRDSDAPAAVEAVDVVRVAQVLQPAAAQPAAAPAADCCQPFKPKGCPAVKPCQRDACVTIQITPLDKQDATFTYNGTNSFMNVFGAAVARGAENATIRAMNAIKVCPNCTQRHEGECDPAKAATPAPAVAPANP